MRVETWAPPTRRRRRMPATGWLVTGMVLLMLLSATGGGYIVDAVRWRTEAPTAIRILRDPSAPQKELREAIVAIQFNVQNAIDALRAAERRGGESAVHARNALHHIAERAR